jgi:hypothetical protein
MRDLQLFIQVRDRYVTNADRYPAWTAIGATARSPRRDCLPRSDARRC